jgi:hypothetical protein
VTAYDSVDTRRLCVAAFSANTQEPFRVADITRTLAQIRLKDTLWGRFRESSALPSHRCRVLR